MLYAFGFEKIGVVLSDLYFVDPNPKEGQEGPEQGVRLEVRLFDQKPLEGSIYSATPIGIEEPVWRADLLESVDNPGSFDRAHHHPRFRGWEPVSRHFVDEMTADPIGWVGKRLEDLETLMVEARFDPSDAGPNDSADLRAAAPEIVATMRRVIDRVRAGELARPPAELTPAGARLSWL